MAFDWSSIFDNNGIKEVTRTDKRKTYRLRRRLAGLRALFA
jgi:hypothetical protein